MMGILRDTTKSVLGNLRGSIAFFLVFLLLVPSPVLSEIITLRNGKTIPDVTPLEYKEDSVVFKLSNGKTQEYKKNLLKKISPWTPKKKAKKRDPGSLKKCLLLSLIIPGAGELCSARDTAGGIMLTLGILSYAALATSSTFAIIAFQKFQPTPDDREVICRAEGGCGGRPAGFQDRFSSKVKELDARTQAVETTRTAVYSSLGIFGLLYGVSILNTWLGHPHRLKKSSKTSQYDTSIRPFFGIIPEPSGQYGGFVGVQAKF